MLLNKSIIHFVLIDLDLWVVKVFVWTLQTCKLLFNHTFRDLTVCRSHGSIHLHTTRKGKEKHITKRRLGRWMWRNFPVGQSNKNYFLKSGVKWSSFCQMLVTKCYLRLPRYLFTVDIIFSHWYLFCLVIVCPEHNPIKKDFSLN